MRFARWLPVGLAVALLGGVVLTTAWSATTHEPDSAFDDGAGGARALVEEADLQGLATQRLLSGPLAFQAESATHPAKTLLVVTAPPDSYTADEAAAVQEFLAAGGRVLVADNFGAANSLTNPLGVTFERVRLVDPGAQDTLLVQFEGQAPLAVGAPAPTALRTAPDVEMSVLGSSSPSSFLDRDGDGLISAGDPPGPFPVVVMVSVGDAGGLLVAVADPTPLMDPDGPADDATFRAALLESMLPDGGRVVVDESRSPSPDPWLVAAGAVVGTATTEPWRTILFGLAVVAFLVGASLVVVDSWRRHRFNVDYFIRRADVLGDDRSARREALSHEPSETGIVVRWTRRGRAAIASGVLLAVLGTALGSAQATWTAAFLLGAGVLAMWTAPARVDARRRPSTHETREDGEVRLDLELGSKRRVQVELLDPLPREFELVGGQSWCMAWIGPDAPALVSYRVRAALRGPYPVGPLSTRTLDPLRLRALESTVGRVDQILVHPRHEPLNRIPFKSRIPAHTLGPHLVNRAGEGSEFHSLRDYQTGDSFRIVNWKASARSKDLVVNQRVHESMATITIFLDARAVTGAGPVRLTPLNEACRAALGIAAGAVKSRDRVRLYAYGAGVRDLARGGGPEQIQILSNVLAELEPKGTTGFREAIEPLLPSVKSGSPVILLSAFEEDPTVLEGLQELRRRGAVPYVVALSIQTQPKGTDQEEPESEPDADRLHAEYESTISELQGAGFPVVPAIAGVPLSLLLRLGAV